jgi:hypothetical protein
MSWLVWLVEVVEGAEWVVYCILKTWRWKEVVVDGLSGRRRGRALAALYPRGGCWFCWLGDQWGPLQSVPKIQVGLGSLWC